MKKLILFLSCICLLGSCVENEIPELVESKQIVTDEDFDSIEIEIIDYDIYIPEGSDGHFDIDITVSYDATNIPNLYKKYLIKTKCSLNNGPDQPLDTNGYEYNRTVFLARLSIRELQAKYLFPGDQACLKCIIYVSDPAFIQENTIFGCIDIE